MRRRAGVIAILAGCSFSHGNLSGGDDSNTTFPEAGPRDTTTIDAPTLVDDHLLVRYFIDEATTGQTPTELVDSAPSPLPLDLHYTAVMNFVEPAAQHRGLRWTLAEDDGRASAPVTGTKISTLLDPSTTFTIELVTELRATGAGECRFISVANGTATYGSIALITSDLVSVRLHLGTSAVTWSVPFAQGRLVLHAVVNTDLATAADRTTLYVNGTAATRTGGTSPSQGYDPPILLTDYLTVGNLEGAGRSPAGDVLYAAIYTSAFTPEQVAINAQRLAISDDR